jgi:DNA-directed RNA polymerase specialized sigma24 family protein
LSYPIQYGYNVSMLPKSADTVQFLRPHILPIYRYHLVQRGDRASALALTIATLRSAQTWLDTYLPATEQDSLAVWLFSIARYKQAFSVHRAAGHSSSDTRVRKLDDYSSDLPEDPQTAPEIVSLWQAQLAWLADAFRQLAPLQSETLALVCFGGLSLLEAADLLRKSPAQIQQLLDNPLASPKQLTELANQISLADNDLEHILDMTTTQPAAHPTWLHRSIWRQAFGLRLFINRIVPAIGLAALLMWVFVISSRPVPLSNQIPQAADQTVLSSGPLLYDLSSAAPRQIQSGPGYLVPPEPTECRYWQSVLKNALSQQVDLVELAPFQNPQATGPSERGTGCQLMLSGSTSHPDQLGAVLQMIQPFFTQEDYSVNSLENCSALIPDKTWTCQGQVFYLQAYSRVILTLSQHPLTSATSSCTPAESASSCQLNASGSQFTIRMQLASNPTQLVVDNFLSRWKIGDDLARNDFTDQLLADLPSVSDLDKLARIDRSPAGEPSFSVQVIQNSGTQLLVQVQVDEIRTPPLPSETISTLQLKLARLNAGWKIQQINANPPTSSPPG